MGFIHPALELVVRKQYFEINELNPNGTRLLKLIAPVLLNRSYLEKIVFEDVADQPALKISGVVKPRSHFFPEEERSRQPSIFSVIRQIFEPFRSDDPYLGLYGAFGYDLVFQYENIEAKHERDPEQTDCHLFFPV